VFPLNGVDGFYAFGSADGAQMVFGNFNQQVILWNVHAVEFNAIKNTER
jgi:hypothetical protein